MPGKLKCLIIDDEKLAREVIRRYLLDYPDIEMIGECGNGFEGIKTISSEKPDIIFLDIQMPKLSGFEMLELIGDPPVIIFTTAFDQYALKAFEVNAADYLLKPFSKERFEEALKRAIHKAGEAGSAPEVKRLIAHQDNEQEILSRVVVKKGSDIIIIPVEEIIYFEAQDDYVRIVAEQGKFLKQKTMKYFESRLESEDFVRIHRSYIVNINYISKIELYEKESYRILMKDEKLLPVSRSGYARIKTIL